MILCIRQSTEKPTLIGQIPATKHLKSRHCCLSSVQPANLPSKVIRCTEQRKRLYNKPPIGIINLHKRCRKVTTVHGPRGGNTSTVCTLSTLAARHKERSGSSTQETPAVLVEEQKKPRHLRMSPIQLHDTQSGIR